MKARLLVLTAFEAAVLLALAFTAAAGYGAAGYGASRPVHRLPAGSGLLPGPTLLVGYVYDAGRERLVSINPDTGAISPLVGMNMEWVGANQFALDPFDRLAYLSGQAPGEAAHRLYTINLTTGAVLSSTLLDTGQGGFGFARSGPGALAAYDFNPDVNHPGDPPVVRILSLNPDTGAAAQVAALDADWTGTGMFAVDAASQTAYLGGLVEGESAWRLYVANLQTGAVASTTLLDTGEGGFGFVPYTPGRLLAYMVEGGQTHIVTLEAATGLTATLATLPLDFTGVGQFAASASTRTAYLGAQAGDGSWRLYTVNLATGEAAFAPVTRLDGGLGFGLFAPPGMMYLPFVHR